MSNVKKRLTVKIGQKREFIRSGKKFEVLRKKYDDRDIYECKLLDGSGIESHNETVIACYSDII